jgi:hypothetical protein
MLKKYFKTQSRENPAVQCSPAANRTRISGSGDLRTIHCTTEPNKISAKDIKTLGISAENLLDAHNKIIAIPPHSSQLSLFLCG